MARYKAVFGHCTASIVSLRSSSLVPSRHQNILLTLHWCEDFVTLGHGYTRNLTWLKDVFRSVWTGSILFLNQGRSLRVLRQTVSALRPTALIPKDRIREKTGVRGGKLDFVFDAHLFIHGSLSTSLALLLIALSLSMACQLWQLFLARDLDI